MHQILFLFFCKTWPYITKFLHTDQEQQLFPYLVSYRNAPLVLLLVSTILSEDHTVHPYCKDNRTDR